LSRPHAYFSVSTRRASQYKHMLTGSQRRDGLVVEPRLDFVDHLVVVCVHLLTLGGVEYKGNSSFTIGHGTQLPGAEGPRFRCRPVSPKLVARHIPRTFCFCWKEPRRKEPRDRASQAADPVPIFSVDHDSEKEEYLDMEKPSTSDENDFTGFPA
jgi:hypothetical protein